MIFYSLPSAFDTISASPFCTKLETWFRLAGVPYERRIDLNKRGPRGKFPWVQLADGRVVCDSANIQKVIAEEQNIALDAGMSAEDNAKALLVQRLCEDHLYWVIVYLRWQDPSGWSVYQQALFGKLPVPLRWVVPPVARRTALQQLAAEGTGRRSLDEVLDSGCADLDALVTLLGDKPFLLGDTPRSIDATLYATLEAVIRAPASRLGLHARHQPTLVAYVDRIRSRVWADRKARDPGV